VGRFLKLYTELPVEECDRLGALGGSEINAAKIVLANEVTTLCHGREAAEAAEATAREVFEKGGVGEDLPTLSLTAAEVGEGISVVQLFVRAGLAKSGKDAKRLIAEGGARLNDAAADRSGPRARHAPTSPPAEALRRPQAPRATRADSVEAAQHSAVTGPSPSSDPRGAHF
jgi:tyrosyl-tRNA synthetase